MSRRPFLARDGLVWLTLFSPVTTLLILRISRARERPDRRHVNTKIAGM